MYYCRDIPGELLAMYVTDFSHAVFKILNFTSMILSILIFKIFQVMRQNILIRSASIIFFTISFLLFLGWPLAGNDLFCKLQALFLNYCFVSAHAHFSFIMWNNLSVAMGWKIFGIQDSTALAGLMMFVSLSIPVVPTIIILAMSLDPEIIIVKTNKSLKEIFVRKAFHCVINEPAWWGYRIWFIIFSGPGIVAACILFIKTIESRRKMLKYSNTSQFSRLQIARMFFAIISYMVLSVMSMFMGFMDTKPSNQIDGSDFVSACVGFLLFITYGVGSTAGEYYKKLYISMGPHFGIDVESVKSSSKDSRENSATITFERRQSSVISSETRLRRQSQLSEDRLEEQLFIYDLPSGSENSPSIHQVSKRNQFRRGSEPSKAALNTTINVIHEVSEESEESLQSDSDDSYKDLTIMTFLHCTFFESPASKVRLTLSFMFNENSSSSSTSSRSSSPAFDFVKGFITGQIALLSLLFFIVRFLFFRSVGPVTPSSNCIRVEASSFPSSNNKKKQQKVASGEDVVSSDKDAALLEKLFGLDHQSLKQQALKSGDKEVLISEETGRWLTFILAKMVFDPFRVHLQENSTQISLLLEEKFKLLKSKNMIKIPSLKHLDVFQIKSLESGNSYPSIDSNQLIYNPESENCSFRLKYSWQNVLALEVESAFTLANLIALPFSVSAKLRNLQFTLQLQSSKSGNEFEVTCLSDDHFLIDLEVSSLVGHRTKLKDLPKIKNAIVDAVKKILIDSVISPKSFKIPIPNLHEKFSWSLDEIDEICVTEHSSGDNETSLKECPHQDQFEFNEEESLISDESEPMNIFMDSRYEDDFNEVGPESFVVS